MQRFSACLRWIVLGCLLTLHASQVAADELYWYESFPSRMMRANVDGTGVQPLVQQSDLGLVPGIAVHPGEQRLYFAADTQFDSVDKMKQVNTDGTGFSTRFIIRDEAQPAGVAIDPSAGKLYWSERFTDRIVRANFDGSNQETIVVGAVEPRGIALDLQHNHVYWVEFTNNRLRRANLDGSNVVDILTGGMNRPFGLTVDPLHETLYWTNIAGNAVNDGTIFRVNFDGTGAQLIADGLYQPVGVVVDPAHERLFWSNGRILAIETANLDGGDRRTLLATQSIPAAMAIQVIIPEPSTLALACLGACMLAVFLLSPR